MMTITGTTQLLGIMGDPVDHSLSPVMHNAALAELGVDYAYVPFPVQAENLATALQGLAAVGVQGFSITIPHKQAILPLLTTVTPEAQAVGAVNTVWRTEQGWAGTNTDVPGFMAPLQNAAKLAKFQASWANTPLAPTAHGWDALPNLLPQADLVVNTTPIGMAHTADPTPLTAAEIALIPAHGLVYDLIYTPRPTRLLTLAAERGMATQDGLEMLVQQGAIALERWIQQPVPIDTMRQALVDWLAQ
jgi:shikimate dehydrogenase